MSINFLIVVLFKLYIINIICIQTRTIAASRETSELLKSLTNYNNNKQLSNEYNKQVNKREAGLGLDVLKSLAIDKFEDLQSKTSQNGSTCIPGSLSYNGTCVFFSGDKQKLSWRNAERFCRKLPFNTSFLVIQNDHQIDTIKSELMRLRNKENPSDQLVFYIGFSFTSNEWKWANNHSLRNTNLTLGRYFWDWTGSHGDCGSIALLKNNELVMRSAPCQSTRGRFICEYTLDPCHENNMCGKYGKCVNLFYKPYCDCSVTIFYEGKYCEKLNWAAVQTIIALIITIILFISIFCQTSVFIKLWNECFGKQLKPEENEEIDDEEKQNNNNNNNQDTDLSEETKKPRVEFSTSLNRTQQLMHSISHRYKTYRNKLFESIKEVNKKEGSAYILLIFTTIFLAFIQVSIIHGFFQTDFLNNLKKKTFVRNACNCLESNYLLEELLYLGPALLVFIVLWFYHRTRRFNKYIMLKFKDYFKTEYYKKIIKEQKVENEKKIQRKKEMIRNQKCGRCKLCMYSCLRKNFSRVFCCLCCCSCCVPPGSDYRCCLCYCCQIGWQNTDCYKVGKAIKNVFYYLFLCCIWKRLWNLTKERRKAKKVEEEKKRRESMQSRTDDLYDIGEVDEDDFDENQEFKRTTFPFPSMPFSTSNRAQSASVYVIYTYDVLNIFVYIYTATVTNISIPYFGRPSGILFDLLIQVLHVFLIGIKFYPILIAADMDPSIVVYLAITIYMFLIWSFKIFTKGFCSRTEAFVKQTLKKLSTDYGLQIKAKFQTRYNISNSVLGLFTDDPDPTKEYLSAIKNVIPKVFKEFFGKYDQLSSGTFEFNTLNDDYNLAPDKYYNPEFTNAIETLTTTSMSTTTTSYGFRDYLKNKTISKAKSFMEILSERNETSDWAISVLENLPLYLTLSYLLSRYLIFFVGGIIDLIRRHLYSRVNNLDKTVLDASSGKRLTFEEYGNVETLIDKYLEKLKYDDEDHFTSQTRTRKNHNYFYIKNLLEDINFFNNYSSSKKATRKKTISFFLDLWQRYVYKNVPYMKYSKQYINTYTVAFMVVYFFTLFGFRLSNLFGNSIIVTFELIYRFIFRGIIPSFNFDDHNFNLEFRITCLFTSFVVAWQLFRSIRSFHNDLIKLHKGEKLITSYVRKYTDKSLILKSAEERNKTSSAITSDSLHFPGYLIAHLVYGYALLFMIFFCFTIFFKLLSYFPKLFQISSQVLLPLVIMVSLKLIVVKYATRMIFLREDGQRITNLAPYYTITYFNFFFDCFLGFVACASRIWQTSVMSVLTLPRLDKSMFNRDNELIMRRLDKGHVAYINYVRMEHWYNNPVVNGFCEMLIESMLCSQIYRFKFDSRAKVEIETVGDQVLIKHELSRNKSEVKFMVQQTTIPIIQAPTPRRVDFDLPTTSVRSQSDDEYYNTLESDSKISPVDSNFKVEFLRQQSFLHKKSNPQFKYSSFLRLRNLFYLCLLLKANPGLRKFRHHYLVKLSKKGFEKDLEVESLSDMLRKKIWKRVIKFKTYFSNDNDDDADTKTTSRSSRSTYAKSDSQAKIIDTEQKNYESNSNLSGISTPRKRSYSE